MRKFILALAIAALSLLANVEPASAQALMGLDEDFNSVSQGIPEGWNNVEGNAYTDEKKWGVNSAGHTGNCLRFDSYMSASGTYNVVKTPFINVTLGGAWKLSFWYKNPAGGNFKVYMTKNGTTTQIPLADSLVYAQNWTYREISLTNRITSADSIQICFYAISNSGNGDAYVYLDDVIVEHMPDCRTPKDLMVNAISTSTADISWSLAEGIDTPSVYIYTLKTAAGVTIDSTATLSAPNNYLSLTGLTPNTTYTVSLTGDCNSVYSGISNKATITFTTLCTAQAAPYSEDFNGAITLPDCIFTRNASLVSLGRTGNAVQLLTSPTEDAYIVFPQLNLQSNNVEASFWIKASGVTGGLTVVQTGLVSDPSDVVGNFELLRTDSLTNTSWNEIRMNTLQTRFPATSTSFIAVIIPAAYARNTFIDDVAIHTVPTCIRPEDFTLTDITSNTVGLSWTSTNASQVSVQIISATDTTYQVSNANPYTVTGLTPNTDYTFRIRGLCSPTDSSEATLRTLFAHTACVVADSAIFIQNFENLSSTMMPDCWASGWFVQPLESPTAVPFAATTNAVHSGSAAMALIAQEEGTRGYLSTQCIPIDQAGKYTLSVWVYRQDAPSYPNEGLKFWIGPDFDDTTGATLLGYIPRNISSVPVENTANEWYNYEYIINTTGNQYILIEGINEFGSATIFDDLQVKRTPSCLKVKNVNIGTPTASSVNIGWTAGKNETQWIVNYTLSQGAATVRTVTDTVTSPTIAIANLSASTTYNILGTVKAYCGGSDVAEPVNFYYAFVTGCNAVSTLPYSCGFESYEISTVTNPLPYCWTRYNDAPVSKNYPYAYTSSIYSRTGSNCLVFSPTKISEYDYGNNQVAVMPQINTVAKPMNTLRSVFYARLDQAYSNGVMIYVGAMTDPEDITTFTTVDSFCITDANYNRCITEFSTYHGNGSYMAIRVPRTNSYYTNLFIDDAVIELIPACAEIAGAGVTISDVTSSSAKLNITDQSAQSFTYAYGIAGTPVASCTQADTTGLFVEINGLQPVTTYDVYVRRNCGNGDYSNWSDKVSFTTSCAALSVPFSDDFEDYANDSLKGCYATSASGIYHLRVHSSTASATGNSQVNHTPNGSKGVCSSSGYTTPYETNGSLRALAYLHLEAGKNYEISSYAKAGNCYNGIGYWNITYQLGTTFNTLTDIASRRVSSTSWARYNAYFSVPATDDYYIGISTSTATNFAEYIVYFDDIEVKEVSCIPPTSSTVTASTSSSATVGFTSTASSWIVAVSSSPINISGAVTGDIMYDTVYTPSFTVNNLNVNTEYYYTIRSLCGVGSASAWMEPASFRTACAVYDIPYTETFETITSTQCWNTLSGIGTISRTATANTGSGAMSVNAATATSPQLNTTNLTPYSLTGWAYSTTDSAIFSIKVAVDPTDASQFFDLADVLVTPANTWVEFNYNFADMVNNPDYSEFANANYVAFATGSRNVAFDDLSIATTPTCPKPNTGTITNVTVHTATLNWNETGSATSWLIETVPASAVAQVATTKPFTVTGLNAATSYTVYVRSICGQNDTSARYKVGTFVTDCDYVIAPYTESFEGFADGVTPTCWDISASTTSTVILSPANVWGVHFDGNNRAIRMNNYNVLQGDAVIYTPEVVLPAGRNFELRYDYCNQANSGNLNVFIKRHRDANFTQIATHQASTSSTNNETPAQYLSNLYSLSAYQGDTIQIQFFNAANYGIGATWVDNVRVREITNCIEPVTVAVSNIAETTATVTFTDTVAAHNNWQYAVGIIGFDVTASTPITTTSKTISLTGLTSSTKYDVYVRTVCNATESSAWTRATFKTTSAPAVLPYFTDFSDNNQNAAWTAFGSGANQFTFGTDANARFAVGNAAMYISNNGQYTYDNTSTTKTAIARLFYFDNTSYNIEFDWKCSGGEGASDYCRFYLVPSSVSPLPTGSGSSYYYYNWPASLIALDGDTYHNLDDESHHVSRVIDFTGKSGSYYLAFVWINDHAVGNITYPLSVGNVSVSEVTCQLVTSPKILSDLSTVTTVTATCNNPNPGAAVRYAVSTTDNIYDTIISGVAPADTFVISGLTPSTTYTLFLRAECSATDVSPWTSLRFTSSCGAIEQFPFVQDFETNEFTPACWKNISTASAINPMGQLEDGRWSRGVFSWTHYGNGNGWAKMSSQANGCAALLVTPAFTFEQDREYNVSFSMYHYGNNYYTDCIDVYVGPNPNKTAAVKLGSYTVYDDQIQAYTEAVSLHSIDIPASMRGTCYVMFEGIRKNSDMIYLDDITVDRYPRCRDLEDEPVVVATTATTATVREPLGIHSAIEFGIARFSVPSITDSIFTTVVTTTGEATFTNLTANTAYSVFARAICSEYGDTTNWTDATMLRTKTDDCFAPDGIHTVGMTTDTSAVVVWNPVPEASTYLCYLNGTSYTTTANQMAFTGLTNNTNYSFSVRAVCGAGDTTLMSDLFNFKTVITPAYIPYFTGFETTDDNALWIRTTSARVNNFVFGSNSGGRYAGSQGLYISNNGTSYAQSLPTDPGSSGDDVYNITFASRNIYFPEAGTYDISFDWKCDAYIFGTYSYFSAYGRAYLAPLDVVFTADDPQYNYREPAGSIVLGEDLRDSKYWRTSSNLVTITEPGYRNVVFMWNATNRYGWSDPDYVTAYPLAVDNFSVEKVECFPANSIATDNVSDTFGDVIVDKAAPVALDYAILTINSRDSIAQFGSVPAGNMIDTIHFTGLTASTQYYVFVRTVCDSAHLGQWRMVPMLTTAVPAALPYVCDFEDGTENGSWVYDLTKTNHFIIGTATSNGGAKAIYITSDNSSNTYDYYATTDAYAYRVFYLNEGLYEFSYDWRANGESTLDYARLFMLPSSVDINDGVQLTNLGMSSLPTGGIAIDGGSYLNQRTDYQTVIDTFRITTAGSYNMVLYWRNDYYNGNNPPLAVDNIALKAVTCLPPSSSLIASETTDTSVTAVIRNFNDSSLLVYAISTSDNIEDAIFTDTIPYTTGVDTIAIEGLNPSTNYRLLTRSLCGTDDESFWNRVIFKTLCGTISVFPYVESFEDMGTSYEYGLCDQICWSALNDDRGFPNYHASTTNPNDGYKCLQMHSQQGVDLFLALPEMADINNLFLSFMMKSETTSGSNGIIYAGYMTDVEDASTFVTLLTTTRRTSWTNQSVMITGAPAGARIAFKYGNAGSNNYYGFLDKVRVSELVQGPTFNDTVCYNKPYQKNGFNQAANTMHVGLNTFTRVRTAVLGGEKDTVYTANVYMRADISSTSYDTVCAGHNYTEHGWNIINPVSRRYSKVVQGGAACGCDSTVALYLTVMPTSYKYSDTICHGDSYLFGDTVLTDPGMYTRSYVSPYGCNSVDTLYLTVMPDSIFSVAEICEVNLPYNWFGRSIYTGGRHTMPIAGQHGCNQTAVLDLTVYETDSVVNVSFCQGGSAQVVDTIIRTAGYYEIVRINQHGCNVTYHITATTTAPVAEDVYDNACEGHLYTGYGISNLRVDADTVVTVTTKTVDAQCDSVANVHLKYVKTVYTDTTAWIKEGEHITWHENTYSTAGDYPVTLQSVATGCDSVVTLHLHVTGTGVENVSEARFDIVPNPMTAGATSFVYGALTGVRSVEILNSFGQVVSEFVPETYPIEIKGLNASGIYYVRIVCDNDKVVVQKLIVK